MTVFIRTEYVQTIKIITQISNGINLEERGDGFADNIFSKLVLHCNF